MRKSFLFIAIPIVVLIAGLSYFNSSWLWAYVVVGPLFIIGVYDLVQHSHTILRNFPVIGHLRYIFELISPEIQQYFIERNTDGMPFSRHHRALAYQRAKDVMDTRPFGTQYEINRLEYEGLRHTIYALDLEEVEKIPRRCIGNDHCKKPYEASILNVSAMSFGSLSGKAIQAMGEGAAMGDFFVNTGEGGISKYHLEPGCDLVWQIGTGYFGCRTKDGNFDSEQFKETARHPNVKMVELKISQGAKPGHGGLLPAIKNTKEIAKVRGIEPHTTVISPPSHKAFHDVTGLLNFIDELRELSGGKPVGFKLCIGRTDEFVELCEKMQETGQRPDFITVDGAEGGTGASPAEFADGVGLPIEPSLIFVNKTLQHYNLRKDIKVIASGKVLTAHSLLKLLALGADICNAARAFMFAVGCVQALRCNNNSCPTGVTTHKKSLTAGLVVKDKKHRAANFHKNTLEATRELMAAIGIRKIEDLRIHMLVRGDEFIGVSNRYFPDSLTPYEKAWGEKEGDK